MSFVVETYVLAARGRRELPPAHALSIRGQPARASDIRPRAYDSLPMGLACNIDARGRVVRLIYGIVMIVLAGVLLFAWARPTGSPWAWVVTILSSLGGAFAIFEAKAGWCVMRAMGFKTPM